MPENILSAGPGAFLTGPGKPTLLDVLTDMSISGLLRAKWWPPQPPAQKSPAANQPPAGNIGNCSGQITAIYYVHDSPGA